jgi:hypothetical protein
MRNLLSCLEFSQPWTSCDSKTRISSPTSFDCARTSDFLDGLITYVLALIQQKFPSSEFGEADTMLLVTKCRHGVIWPQLRGELLALADEAEDKISCAARMESVVLFVSGLHRLLLFIGLVCARVRMLQRPGYTQLADDIVFDRGFASFIGSDNEWIRHCHHLGMWPTYSSRTLREDICWGPPSTDITQCFGGLEWTV